MRTPRTLPAILISTLLLAGCQRDAAPDSGAAADPAASLLARGEYVVKIGGCNDCHTPGYGPSSGNMPKQQWLTGSDQGFVGPWGTTYASNLRLSLSKMTEAEWLVYSSTFRTRPPMPDFNVHAMSEEDRRAVYRFVASLGAAGEPAPDYLPPGQTPAAPYFQLVLPAAPEAGTPPDGRAAKAQPAS